MKAGENDPSIPGLFAEKIPAARQFGQDRRHFYLSVVLERFNGVYTYDYRYMSPWGPKPVPFELEWTLTDDLLRGSCLDAPYKGLSGQPASLTGFILEELVHFVKTYPVRWGLDEAGKPVVRPDEPPQAIQYAGIRTAFGYKGTWSATVRRTDADGSPYDSAYTGKWHMQRMHKSPEKDLL